MELLETKVADDILRLVNGIYHTIVYVDLADSSYQYIRANDVEVRRVLEKNIATFRELGDAMSEVDFFYAEDVVAVNSFFDVGRIRRQFDGGRDYLSMTSRRLKNGRYCWDMVEIIPSRAYSPDNPQVVICVRDVDEVHQRELDHREKLVMKERQLIGKKTILVVDDDEINRDILCANLEADYHTVDFANGREALDYLRANGAGISVILTDLQMPVMDGYGLLRECQKDDFLRLIPVLVLTGADTDEDETACLRAGAMDFVTKPFNPDILLSRIQHAIALHENTVMLNLLRMDNTTGCYTREYFIHMANLLLNKYPDEDFDLVCSHVVNLTNIKEQYGAGQGDAIMRYLASIRYQGELEHMCVMGRLDDSTLAHMMPHSLGRPKQLEQEGLDNLNEFDRGRAGLPPFMKKYGVYESVDRSESVSVMCNRALMALSNINNAYGEKLSYYDDTLRKAAMKRQRILENMEDAITQRQFQVWYQPKHRIANGELVGAEALVRWIHPIYGFMSPGDFIPIFEENGFVTRVDRYVWEEACAALRRWKDSGLRTVPVSVNISRRDFVYFQDTQVLKPLVDEYGLDTADLHVEVTESAYVENPDVVTKYVNNLRDQGFNVELDDFGSGYSSLNMFGHMNIDVVKLDMKFIRQEQTEKNDKMIRYIIEMCKNMGITVLSEGVETEEQLQRLRGMGCDFVQGYYYSKPLPEKDFVEYLQKSC